MKVPAGLVGAAVVFWGWQTGWLILAVPLALALEARSVFEPDWTLEEASIARVADLSSLALLGVGAFLLVTLDGPRTARTVLGMAQWLPLTLAPLAFVQAYATRAPLDLSVLFVTLRNRPPTGVRVQFEFIYVAACAIGAATANVRTEWYYAGVAMLAAWSLWNLRSRRWNRLVPFALLTLASVMGYAGHIALNQLQTTLSDWAGAFADSSRQTNPWRQRTDIGHIGELKLSDRILLRVTLSEGAKTPLLLHRASYNHYAGQAWSARAVRFESLAGDPAAGWTLREGAGDAALVEVLEQTRTGSALLSLPTGTARISGLPPAEVKTQRMGSVGVQTAPGFLRYRAHHGAGGAVESPPEASDMNVPAREEAAIRTIAAELKLEGLAPAEALARVQRFFAEDFTYATWQDSASRGARTPLAAFLTKTRSGHCEYFASATVLLLRAAGIPARYATGFSVQERSTGRDVVVRERHAPAWARVWIGGAWVDVDTTPPQWFAVEAADAGAWQALGDAWARVKFAWGAWQTSDEDVPRPLLIALLALLFLVLGWRIARGVRRGRVASRAEALRPVPRGADSAFYAVERVFAGRGLGRSAGEPVFEWIARLERGGVDGTPELRAMARLHYRLRFDPLPADAASQDELRRRVERWLASDKAPA